jgi:DNA-binding NarL/FixJ family response regulator
VQGAVLIVEDHASLAHRLCELASMCRLRGVIAGCASDARRLIASAWRAVIVDHHLPDGSGLDVLDFGRASYTGPALVLTGHDSPKVANRAYDLGASYVVKPMRAERITRFLSGAVDSERDDLDGKLEAWQSEYALSVAELNGLELAADGKTHDQIAFELHVSGETVKSHVKSLLRKTHDRSLTHAALRLARTRVAG